MYFISCFWHGDFHCLGHKCPLLNSKLNALSKNPSGEIYSELHQKFETLKENILTQYKDEIQNVHVMHSCTFLEKKKLFLKKYIKPLGIPPNYRLKPRQAVRGGRSETYMTFLDSSPDIKLFYKDINREIFKYYVIKGLGGWGSLKNYVSLIDWVCLQEGWVGSKRSKMLIM